MIERIVTIKVVKLYLSLVCMVQASHDGINM